MKTKLTEIRQRWSKAKFTKTTTFWIVFGAIILTMILGFSRGGWTTEKSANKLAETTAQSAVIARLAPICVAQFNADSQRTVKHEEFMATSSFQRSNYVKDQGWATMPGDTTPDNRVANECAKKLSLITE